MGFFLESTGLIDIIINVYISWIEAILLDYDHIILYSCTLKLNQNDKYVYKNTEKVHFANLMYIYIVWVQNKKRHWKNIRKCECDLKLEFKDSEYFQFLNRLYDITWFGPVYA